MIAGSEVQKVKDGLELAAVRMVNDDALVEAKIERTKVAKLVAGGNESVTWFAAELAVSGRTESGTQGARPLSVLWTEVAVRDGSTWKTVSAAFAPSASMKKLAKPLAPVGEDAATLGAFAGAPARLATALAADAVVYGTDANERKYGAAAKALVASWKSLAMSHDGKVREVRTKLVGSAIANVNLVLKGGDPYRMRCHLVALPKPDGTWSIVIAHYVP